MSFISTEKRPRVIPGRFSYKKSLIAYIVFRFS